jgi:small subunit ribosomal protein S20
MNTTKMNTWMITQVSVSSPLALESEKELLQTVWACDKLADVCNDGTIKGGETVPNIKSAEKRVRITERRTLRNASLKSALRTTIKKFETALAQSDVNQARLALKVATRALDKAVTKGIIHRNTASRKKSRLTKRFNAVAAKQA